MNMPHYLLIEKLVVKFNVLSVENDTFLKYVLIRHSWTSVRHSKNLPYPGVERKENVNHVGC